MRTLVYPDGTSLTDFQKQKNNEYVGRFGFVALNNLVQNGDNLTQDGDNVVQGI